MADRTFELNKLVRDGIVSSTESHGGSAIYRQLTGFELIDALIDKLNEESQEFRVTGEPKELAQVLGIVLEIGKQIGMDLETLMAIEQRTQNALGGYDKGTYVETVTLPNESVWAGYYATDPNRFPEVTE